MMGFSRGTYTDTRDSSNASDTHQEVFSVVADNFSGHNRFKLRTFLRKMIWEFALACISVPRGGEKGLRKRTLEQNKVWLLAESGGCEGEFPSVDPHSVHSSFRFSFCSQVEVESLNMSSSAARTTLIVNLEFESRTREVKWRRMNSLEKSISPVVNTLIRFNYGEILSATSNFSKGNLCECVKVSNCSYHRVGTHRRTDLNPLMFVFFFVILRERKIV
jgi:hypothetical protein